MRRLENKRKGTFQLLQNSLDELGEAHSLIGLRIINVFSKDCDSFGIRLALKLVSTFLEDKTKFSGVCHNTIVN